MKLNEALLKKYTTKAIKKKSRPGCWDVLAVEVYDSGKKIGEYKRSYSSMMNTFHPFTQDGKDYALYSADYTTTRVMALPSCKDIGGEKSNSFGFCPVEFAVVHEQELYDCMVKVYGKGEKYENLEHIKKSKALINGELAFVSGCVWGDDSSWKVQFINLKKMKDGLFFKGRKIREDWMGYTELPRQVDLKDAITFEGWDPDFQIIEVSTPARFDLEEKKRLGDD